jgi:hypothetical protein
MSGTVADPRNTSTEEGERLSNDCSSIGFTVWYRIEPTEDMLVDADTFGTQRYTNMTVLEGTTIDGLTEIGCDDEGSGSGESDVQFVARAGDTYYLQVGRSLGSSGPGMGLDRLVVNVAQIPLPPAPVNDDIEDATPITTRQEVVDLRNASAEAGEPTDTCELHARRTVWYSISVDEPTVLRADTFGTWEDTATYSGLGLFRSAGPAVFDDLSLVRCGGFQGPYSTEGRVRVVLDPGVRYLLQAGQAFGRRGMERLHVNLDLSQVAPVGNDEPADAIAIGSLPYSASVDPIAATTAPDDPICGEGGGTLWWSLTTRKAQRIQAHTLGSDGPALVSVWTRVGGALEPVACWESDRVAFDALAGATYLFMAAPRDRSSERLTLRVQTAPTITVKVKDTGTVDEFGQVQLTGTVRCTVETWVSIDGTLRQRMNRRLATGPIWGGTDDVCIPGDAVRWTAWVYYSDTGIPFRTGSSMAEVHAAGWDPVFNEPLDAYTTGSIRLSR